MQYAIHRYLTDDNVQTHDFSIPIRALKAYSTLKHISKPLLVDGGAYRGAFIDAVLAEFSSADIYAYEPHPANVKCFGTKSYPHNVHLLAKALGNKVGTIDLLSTGDDANPNSFIDGGPVVSKVNYRVSVEVTAISAELERSPEMVKLDLQGGEEAALKGAGELLSGTPLMWVEAYLERRRGKTLIEFIKNAGFDLFYGPFQYGVTEAIVLKELEHMGIRTGKSYSLGVNYGFLPKPVNPDIMDSFGLVELPQGLNYLAADILAINERLPIEIKRSIFTAAVGSHTTLDYPANAGSL